MYFSSGKIRLRCRLSRNFYIRDIKFFRQAGLKLCYTKLSEADRGMKLSSACVPAKLNPNISNVKVRRNYYIESRVFSLFDDEIIFWRTFRWLTDRRFISHAGVYHKS